MNQLNILVLESGTIALWQRDDVDHGWALTAAEARSRADACDRAISAGDRNVILGETDAGPVLLIGEADVIARIGAALRAVADQAEAKTAVRH